MFRFEPNLREFYYGSKTTQDIIDHTWCKLSRQKCYELISRFWQELEQAFCGDDEISELYVLRSEPNEQRILMYRVLDKISGDEAWVGVFYIPSPVGMEESLLRPQLLWFNRTE